MKAKVIGKKVMVVGSPVIEGEKCVDSFECTLPRTQGDVDLATLKAYAELKRSDGSVDKLPLSSSVKGTEITVSTKIVGSMTAVSGETEVQLSFESTDGQTVMRTEKFPLYVSPSVNAYRQAEQQAPSVIEHLKEEMNTFMSATQRLADEMEGKITALEEKLDNATVYDEDHKLPASYVDGLAAVAASGSYGDLTDAPDMSEYCTQDDMATVIRAAQKLLQPLVLKYIGTEEGNEQAMPKVAYNKELLKTAVQESDDLLLFKIYMIFEDGGTVAPLSAYKNSGEVYTLYFTRSGKTCFCVYDAQNDNYSYGE